MQAAPSTGFSSTLHLPAHTVTTRAHFNRRLRFHDEPHAAARPAAAAAARAQVVVDKAAPGWAEVEANPHTHTAWRIAGRLVRPPPNPPPPPAARPRRGRRASKRAD